MTRQFGRRNKENDAHDMRVLINSTSVPAGGTDHGTLIGLSDDDHSQYVHLSAARSITAQHTFAPTSPQAPFALGANAQGQTVVGLKADQLSKSISVSGLGLSGGGILDANRTITLASSSNPGAAASVLATDASGFLSLIRLNTDTLVDRSGGNITIAPAGDVTFNPGGKDLLPYNNYDLNIGSINKKYLTLHAAELWVQTLVASDVMATIGGRVVVAPTTFLLADLSDTVTNLLSNPGFETAGGGGADIFADWDEYWADGSISQDAGTTHSGSYSCKIVAGASVYTIVQKYILVSPWDGYSFSFWTRGDGTNAGRYAIYDNNNAVWVIPPTSTGVTGTTWTQVKFTAQAPAGCYVLGLLLMCPAINGGYAFFDDALWYKEMLITKHDQMAIGDIAYMEKDGKVEFIRIIVGPWGTGPYGYFIERDLDGTGANAWYTGDSIMNTGQIGNGYIDIYSVRSILSATQYGPTIVGNYRWGTAYNQVLEAWAIGNLNGLYDYGTNAYGVGLGFNGWGGSYITIDGTSGIKIHSKSNTGVHTLKFHVHGDGDLLIGEDISAAGTTFLAVFSNAQTYNSESMSAGDVLIGDNSTSKANILWDKSAGELLFRGGVTMQAKVSTSGAIVAGAGAVVMDANGIWIKCPTSETRTGTYAFTNSSEGYLGGLRGYDTGTIFQIMLSNNQSDSRNNIIDIQSNGDASHYARITLTALGSGSSQNAAIYMDGATGNIGMGGASYGSIGAKLDIRQGSGTLALPVLKLQQLDIDVPFIDFVGTSAADKTRSLSTGTSWTIGGAIAIYINGVLKWIPYYT